jgi:hypothetical protein
MYGLRTLKPRIAIGATTVECPVKGCARYVPRMRLGDKFTDTFRCLDHAIAISPSTFKYDDASANLLWREDQAVLAEIAKVKRESRMAHDNSEDALTWNVFRALDRDHDVAGPLARLIDHPLDSTADLTWWSWRAASAGRCAGLAAARTTFGEPVHLGSEPDLIVRTADALVLIEAKLTAGNTTAGPSASRGYRTGGGGWFATVFASSYDDLIADRRAELMRLWLLGSWMAAQEGLAFVMVGLVREEQDRDLARRFGDHLRQAPDRRFVRASWEALFRDVDARPRTVARDALLDYARHKTIGYRAGALTPAFALTR